MFSSLLMGYLGTRTTPRHAHVRLVIYCVRSCPSFCLTYFSRVQKMVQKQSKP